MAEEVIGLLFGVEGVGVNGASGQEIVKGLTQIVNEINSGKSTVPKIKFQFDTTEATKAVDDLKAKLKDIEKIASIKVTQSGGEAGKGGTTQDLQKQIEKYQKLSATIKQWVQTSKQGSKLAAEYSTVTRAPDGTLSGEAKGYEQTIASINEVNKAMKALQLTFDEGGAPIEPNEEDFAKVAAEIGITEEQYRKLFEQVKVGSATVGVNVENANRKNQQSWTATASKIRDEVQRMYSTIAKDPNARKMADEIIKYSKSAEGSVGELKNKYDTLRNAIHESGADIETWGDKFQKTFAGKVRSALAGAITIAFTKYLREVYQNVVKIDEAMTNLQIASGKTRDEIKALIRDYSALAKQLGATTLDVAEGADTWLRQGYAAEETNTLIKNSTMLSKLGQMEAAASSKALTSAMKGYKVAVEDSIGIVDKFTAVDMEAAASAGDIATAMAETATSADIAGVSMDKLIGYIATVKEVTQDGAESVGTFYKTLFARMNNVKAGKFVDDDTGEALNDVEKTLGALGIALRDANGLFRNSGDVLDEVGRKWEEFDNVQQHAIATAFAGTRQQEKFIVLMENYGTAIKYAETAAGSAGTAMEKFGAYTESIDGKMNSLKAVFEEFSITILNSDIVAGVVDFFGFILEGLNGVASFIDKLGGLPTVLLAVASALLLVNGGLIAYNAQMKITTAYTAILGFFTKLKTGLMSIVHAIPNAIVAWKAYAAGTVSASTAMQASIPVIGLVLAAVTALVGALSIYNGQIDEARQETLAAADAAADASEEIYKLTQEYISLSDAVIDDITVKEKLITCEDTLIKKLGVEKAELQELIDKYGNYEDAVKAAAVAKLQDEERDLRSAYHITAEDLVENQGEESVGLANLYGTMAVKVKEDEEAVTEQAINAINQLISSGKVSSYSASFAEGNAWRGDGLFNILWSGDGVSPDSPEDILAAYEDIKTMLDYVQSTVGDDNKVYDELLTIYNNAKSDVEKYSSAIDALNTNLAEQYVVSGLIGREIPANKADFDSYRQSVIDSAIASGEFAGKTEDVERAIDSILKQNTDFIQFYATTADGAKGVTVALKSAFDILEEVQDGYDGLSDALTNVTSEGYLTADALASLAKLEEDGALAGLKLADILTQDANGYKLEEDALQKYVQALISAYTVEGAFASQKDKENAIANLENLRSVLATLMATQEEATDANKAYREELEKEQDMYENQLDKFEELIDLRKNLLQTYKEELDYQKELEKRQRNVTALQTKLSVARLDQSAAGQARVRELEAELKSAQEDLEDFTLEHAIDVLTDQLESTNAEWKAIIQGKLDEITQLLEGLDNTPDVNINVDTSWKQSAMAAITGAIEKIGGSEVVDNTVGAVGTGGGTLGTYDQWSDYWFSQNPGVYGPPPPMPDGWTLPVAKTRWTSYQDAADAGYANIRTRTEFARGGGDKTKYGTYQAYLDAMYQEYMGKAPVYHTGGIVGGVATLASTEEFAKLLKGEFVSTPVQMKRFMEKTLPQIVNYANGGSNEFNAPLIEITCENVTSESLPELERVVNEAVKEIKKQLDSGMSRTGYKRQTSKRLT